MWIHLMRHRHRGEDAEGCGERRFAHGHGQHGRWPFGGAGRGMGRGMRVGRMFEQGDVRAVILALIAEKPRHGYDLIKAIENLFGGHYAPSPGIIYPTLTLLEEQGFLKVEETDGSKKLFGLTEEGRAWLAANQADVDRIFARIQAVADEASGGGATDLTRAVRNIQRSVFFREGKVAWTPAQIAEVVALLDRTAAAIEQI